MEVATLLEHTQHPSKSAYRKARVRLLRETLGSYDSNSYSIKKLRITNFKIYLWFVKEVVNLYIQ